MIMGIPSETVVAGTVAVASIIVIVIAQISLRYFVRCGRSYLEHEAREEYSRLMDSEH